VELNTNERDYYAIQIATKTSNGDPIPAADWEASFDGGTTWIDAVVQTDPETGDWSTWLLVGPDVAQGTAVAVITDDLRPQVRATDGSAVIVERAPRIRLIRL